MNDRLILLDTTVIIDYLRGGIQVVSFFERLNTSPTISLVTEAEIYQGAKNAIDLKKWEKLISKLKILPITPEISYLAINLLKRYRLSNGLHILDSIIAATAITNNYSLVSANRKHFAVIKGLTFIPWPIGSTGDKSAS